MATYYEPAEYMKEIDMSLCKNCVPHSHGSLELKESKKTIKTFLLNIISESLSIHKLFLSMHEANR